MAVDFTGITSQQAAQTYSVDELLNSIDKMLDGILSSLDMPEAAAGTSSASGLPVLPAPAGPLSLDTLLSAIGDDVRRQTCRDGVASIEMKGERQAEINQKELEEIAAEGKTFPVECQFCDTVYEFTPDEIRKLLKNA